MIRLLDIEMMKAEQRSKNRLLVFASTFPRWKDDTNPPFVYELSKRLTKDFDVYVLAPHYPGAEKYEVMDKMKVHRFRYFFNRYEKLAGSGGILPTLKKNKWFYLQVPFFLLGEYFALKRLVKEIKPDVIHAHWIIPQGFIAALVKKSTSTPYVVTTMGGDIYGLQGKLSKKLKHFALKNASDISVLSNAMKKEIVKLNPKLKVKVIPLGVDTKLFNLNKKDLKIKKKFNIDGPFLLFVGRLTEKKGVKYLIEAMPEVIRKFPKTKLMIIGSGELEEELKDLTKTLKFDNNIIFMRAIANNELPKYYATADIFVGPSVIAKGGDTEGLGVTFIEAMASGCLVIGTNVGGISDSIKNNETGYIVKEKSNKEISEKIIKVLENKKIMKNITRHGEKFARENFDWEIVINKYREVL